MTSRVPLLAVVLAVVLALASPLAAPASPAAAADATVTAGPDDTFAPRDLRVRLGTRVVWRFTGDNHSVTSSTGLFDSHPGCGGSGSCAPVGTTYAFTPTRAGTYAYYCRPHGSPDGSGMAGTVTVVSEPAVSLVPAAATITATQRLTLSGRYLDGAGRPVPSAAVTVDARPAGRSTFAASATVRTDAAGVWRTVVTPPVTTAYRARAAGAASGARTVTVRRRVDVTAPAAGTTVSAARPVAFRGRVLPAAGGLTVRVLEGSRVVASGTTLRDGTWSASGRLTRGDHRLVVTVPAAGGNAAGSRGVLVRAG